MLSLSVESRFKTQNVRVKWVCHKRGAREDNGVERQLANIVSHVQNPEDNEANMRPEVH